MGALTLKNFPFTLRSWTVKSYSSINPTDSFGQSTKVYVNKNQIVKIEPEFSIYEKPQWLTDKGRQFFDSILMENLSAKTVQRWDTLFENINKTFYVFDICNFKIANRNFFYFGFRKYKH